MTILTPFLNSCPPLPDRGESQFTENQGSQLNSSETVLREKLMLAIQQDDFQTFESLLKSNCTQF